ncbi:MAG: hypothetical protein KJ718_03325 [Nanoarchaeota archaeon]|nr:hypothetical protein [Nanoarchaeota archaeon]MBU1051560.1 hypothetical protein [Nanoarchaeota archaeon]
MFGVKDALMRREYNRRERINIYAGAVLGAVAPLLAIRYILFGGMTQGETEGLAPEFVKWGLTLAVNCVTCLKAPCLPVPAYTAMGGAVVGTVEANKLQKGRFERESAEEREQESQLAEIA